MKVYLGPYPNNPNFAKTFKWVENWFGEDAYNFLEDYAGHSIDKFLLLFRREKKDKVRIDDYDLWNTDETLAIIIHPLLVRLKEIKHGSPFVDYEDAPKELRPNPTELATIQNGSMDSKFQDRWEWVLDEMIWAFEQYTKDWEEEYSSGVSDWQFIQVGEYTELCQGPDHTYKVDYEGVKKHKERMDNGLRLFAKYYGSLWD